MDGDWGAWVVANTTASGEKRSECKFLVSLTHSTLRWRMASSRAATSPTQTQWNLGDLQLIAGILLFFPPSEVLEKTGEARGTSSWWRTSGHYGGHLMVGSNHHRSIFSRPNLPLVTTQRRVPLQSTVKQHKLTPGQGLTGVICLHDSRQDPLYQQGFSPPPTLLSPRAHLLGREVGPRTVIFSRYLKRGKV